MMLFELPRCHWCGCKLGKGGKKATIDHMVPRSKGGSDAEFNLVLSCESCNHDKGDRMDFTRKEAKKNRHKSGRSAVWKRV